MITTQTLAEKLSAYLHHKSRSEELVDWAVEAMMDGDFEPKNIDILRDIVARLGVADVRAFGLTWDDCEGFLNRLGYRVKIEVESLPSRKTVANFV